MKKLTYLFCCAWALYALIITGHEVLQTHIFRRLQQSPSIQQARSGDIFNRGAVLARSQKSPESEYAVLFTEDPDGSLKALSLTYWLYPTHLLPTGYFVVSDGVRVMPDPAGQFAQVLLQPKADVIYFAGRQQTLDANAANLAGYRVWRVTEHEKLVFVKLEKR